MIFWQAIHIIEILLWFLFAASASYILFFAVVSLMWKKQVSPLSAYLTDKLSALRE